MADVKTISTQSFKPNQQMKLLAEMMNLTNDFNP